MTAGHMGERILSFEEAEDFREMGWRAADLHVHTLYSRDVLPAKPLHPKALYTKARKLGMDFITFTDHDTMAAYEVLGRQMERLVSGVEIRIKDPVLVGHTIHVNVYDLDSEQFLDLEEIALEGDLMSFLDYLKDYDLPFIYNHPLWFEEGEIPNLASIPEIVKLFPIIEYNMNLIDRKNELTMELASRYNRGLVAATDSHSGRIGKIYTLSKGETFREFFRNIRKGNSYIVVEDLSKENIIEEINAWIGLIFSLDKIEEPFYGTGISSLDRIIHALSSETLRDFPRLLHWAMNLAYKLSNTGLPATLYLRSESSLLPEIEMQLASILRERVL